MKKILIAAAVVAVGAGGYWFSQQSGGGASQSNEVLASVPADTPIFSGQLTPFPIKSYINSLSQSYKTYPEDMFAELEQSDDARAKFFVSLSRAYMDSMKSGQQFVTTFGLADEIRSYFYTLGLLPVLKLDVEKPEAIWALLDKAEKDSGFSHQMKTLKGLSYRSYTLTDAGDAEPIELVFSQQDGLLTITLNASILAEETLETALGINPVTPSLADSKILQDIIKTHGFSDEAVGFINHQELVKAITTKDGNQLARQVTAILAQEGEDPLLELRSPECHSEFTAIAANWPRTVFGLNSVSIGDQESSLDFSTVIESKNQTFLNALKSMRGFIPDYVKNSRDSVFSMGLGIELNQLVPSLTAVWDEMLQPQYQCQVLQEFQQEMSGQNPAMLGMFTGMANGVHGVSAALLDYKFTEQAAGAQGEPSLESVDAIISLSADNPSILFNMVKPFAPELANIQLPQDGSPVDLSQLLPLPPEYGISPKLALKGKHLVLYTGDKAEAVANKLADEKLDNNGLYSVYLDYSKVFAPILSLAEMTGEPLPEEFSMMKDYNMQVQMGLDINDQGIVFDSYMNSKATPGGE
ncbi:hypothetical protein [Shewanella sp.]|uniref:hypothetical protein n=1 Tax=Shewanella sp. TaxID=50422 RepID=UPI0025873ED2|nr:hypothetical protein [Shewanella sp.]MCJ8301569.1 hypothetical protein [Shewanella sp.]